MKGSFKPDHRLIPYISRYWAWEQETELPTVLPGTGAELIFYYGDNIPKLPSNMLLPRKNLIDFTIKNKAISFIAVRFRHHALRHFCEIPMADMIDIPLSAYDIWGDKSIKIEQHIIESSTMLEKISRLDNFLLELLACYSKKKTSWLDSSSSQLYQSKSEHNLDMIIKQSQMSTRYFQKIFKYNMGVSPKYFQRLARFENVVRILLLNKNRNYNEIALEHGYYDQAHFIKECKQFTHCTPLNFLQEKNFRTHFYNQSLDT